MSNTSQMRKYTEERHVMIYFFSVKPMPVGAKYEKCRVKKKKKKKPMLCEATCSHALYQQ